MYGKESSIATIPTIPTITTTTAATQQQQQQRQRQPQKQQQIVGSIGRAVDYTNKQCIMNTTVERFYKNKKIA